MEQRALKALTLREELRLYFTLHTPHPRPTALSPNQAHTFRPYGHPLHLQDTGVHDHDT